MTKADLHRLIDELPESEQETAFRILGCLKDERRSGLARAFAEEIEDPFLCALAAAPLDDEPEAPEEAEAVREGEEAIARGDVIPWGEAKQRLRDMP